MLRQGFTLPGAVIPYSAVTVASLTLRPSVVAPPAITESIRLDPPGAESVDGPRLPRRGSSPMRRDALARSMCRLPSDREPSVGLITCRSAWYSADRGPSSTWELSSSRPTELSTGRGIPVAASQAVVPGRDGVGPTPPDLPLESRDARSYLVRPDRDCPSWSPPTPTCSTTCCAWPRPAAPTSTSRPIPPRPGPRYRAAPLVLIGADQAAACLRARLPAPVTRGHRGRGTGGGHGLGGRRAARRRARRRPADRRAVARRPVRRAATDSPPGRVLAVIGGRGGAGASILAGGLAVTAVRRRHAHPAGRRRPARRRPRPGARLGSRWTGCAGPR